MLAFGFILLYAGTKSTGKANQRNKSLLQMINSCLNFILLVLRKIFVVSGVHALAL